ncbi:MAG: hypothetical protein M1818_002165 [Claussenomyces sp. TS43310]|nr:MAG: hypothetical protein M1818_002165 [Claussenomyces sp. TS43310]
MFRPLRSVALVVAVAVSTVSACDDCYGPTDFVAHERLVRRMQPTAENASYGPYRPLDWGQINFLQTTDTHGWLEGHIKERNYGADWGDFVSFTHHMKRKAQELDVDLLLIDTGDLHDGAGLSDASTPNGIYSNPIFENIDYDLLTIGNHELYISDISYETFRNFSAYYGDKYLTSNVQIYNPQTKAYEYIGAKYRYFSTEHGLRIMAFGVIFDFTGNSNASIVTKTADLVKQQWFLNAINYTEPIDLFLVLGHNPPRTTSSTSTFGTLYKTIRSIKPNTPIQAFGGHTHVLYDHMATGLEAGRYCETLGWLSMTGIDSPTYFGEMNPEGVPNPTTIAVKTAAASSSSVGSTNSKASASPHAQLLKRQSQVSGNTSNPYRYSRRYLDWNRLTFAYHANGSQNNPFDIDKGTTVTNEITSIRSKLNLTSLYGCAPATYCQSCKPFGTPGNIFGLLTTALAATVINETRKSIPRLILINTGSIRFDLVEGPFTYDDSFIVSPFTDGFQFIPEVPYEYASQVLGILNAGPYQKRDFDTRDFSFTTITGAEEPCLDPHLGPLSPVQKRSSTRGIVRRQSTSPIVPGYTTTDDFGSDGDDTKHSSIPYYSQPNDIQANASFPLDGSAPPSVDLIFLDFIAKGYVVPALQSVGANYTMADVSYYLPSTFTTNSYLPAYAKLAWQKNVPNCPIGPGVGF